MKLVFLALIALAVRYIFHVSLIAALVCLISSRGQFFLLQQRRKKKNLTRFSFHFDATFPHPGRRLGCRVHVRDLARRGRQCARCSPLPDRHVRLVFCLLFSGFRLSFIIRAHQTTTGSFVQYPRIRPYSNVLIPSQARY